ncbi:MAG: PxKF domain-containing protein [Patescibacteria group bacterium]|nr:PxKF domain-containing protein [Patescibacteria group bacterium]
MQKPVPISFMAAFAAFIVFSAAAPAFAADTYWRTPADAAVSNPVTFHFDYANWDSDMMPDFNGSALNFQYFLLHVTDGINQYNSAVLPCTDIGGLDPHCTGTADTPKSIDFTATLATTSADYYVRLCGSVSSTVNAQGYFTETNSCITWDGFRTAPMDMRADSFAVLPPPLPQKYVFGGFLAPVKADGSGVYERGRTLPVKFQLTDAEGRIIPDALATLELVKVSDGAVQAGEAPLSSAAGTSNQFRYDALSNQYVYNLATGALAPGIWLLEVQLDDGRQYTVEVSIR